MAHLHFLLAMPGGIEWMLVFFALIGTLIFPVCVIILLVMNNQEKRKRMEVLRGMGLGSK